MRRIHAFVRVLPRRPLRLAARAALALLAVLSAVVSTPSTQAQIVVTLYSFKGAPDGAIPYGGLILDASGHLYGTTELGGLSDAGTVFKLDGSGNETVLHSFSGSSGDGAYPFAALIRDAAGNLYGTTAQGGLSSVGTVFKLDSSGNETVLHSFSGSSGDGAYPFAALIRDPSGNLYSTTYWGGQYGEGTAFKLDQSGAETVLHSFGESAMDGTNPYSDLILDASGHLYGTTQNSLAAGAGTIFKLDSAGRQKVLHTFTGGADGASPLAGLIGDAAGYLYGITGYGGDNVCGCGTVFKIDRRTRKGHVLHRFTGGADGAYPQAGLVRDAAGDLYGTTAFGGDAICGCGTVFKVDMLGTETVLYRFTGGADGAYPRSSLIRDSAGNLYGTTSNNGVNGFGTVFKLTP